jgi:hypothetical protein
MGFRRSVFLIVVLAPFLGAMVCAQPDERGADGLRHSAVLVIESESGRHAFSVELADDQDEVERGLMFRTELAADAGMLFDFGESMIVSMWMKNTLIPLDIAFIDEAGVIRRIAKNASPRSLENISSEEPVLAALEVNGGVFDRLEVKVGDRVRHPIFSEN